MSIRSLFPRESRLFLCWTVCFIAVAMGAVYFIDYLDTTRQPGVSTEQSTAEPSASEDAPAPAATAESAVPDSAPETDESGTDSDTPEDTPAVSASLPTDNAPDATLTETSAERVVMVPDIDSPPAGETTNAPGALPALSSTPDTGETDNPPPSPDPSVVDKAPEADESRELDPAWRPLIARLTADGFEQAKMEKLFASLGPDSYSPAFMGAKIRELHGVGGIGVKNGTEVVELPEGYTQPLSDITMGSCKALMTQYAAQFEDIQKRYGVSPNIILAILLVETALGTDLGDQTALRALGSMAATTTTTMLGRAGNGSQVRRVSRQALNATLSAKSDWAYDELKALINYGEKSGADVTKMPGSMYGAVGLCQFMPSNIERYGVDGDSDGKVDPFSVPDAIYSVANYLKDSGWSDTASSPQKMQVIRAYNMDTLYAARVLGTSNQIALGIKGRVADSRSPVVDIPISARDPSLRRQRPVPPAARVKPLGNYQDILQ